MNYKLLVVFILSYLSVTAQDQINCKVYTFRSPDYFYLDTLILYENGQFRHRISSMVHGNSLSVGNWQHRDSFIIMDSYPQREKVLVHQSNNKKGKKIDITVMKKNKYPIIYKLYIKTNSGDTLILDNQFEKTTIRNINIEEFWIIDTRGFKTEAIKPYSNRINHIDVYIEQNRVFENEHWLILNEYEIRPLMIDGTQSNYTLKKQ